jgi:hypothetical protein
MKTLEKSDENIFQDSNHGRSTPFRFIFNISDMSKTPEI